VGPDKFKHLSNISFPSPCKSVPRDYIILSVPVNGIKIMSGAFKEIREAASRFHGSPKEE
jgi:hypothetical protein